jgi:Antibiotic biosynthesis monooxygenase
MVYRLVRFTLGCGQLDAAKKIFKDLVPKISAQPGCRGVTAFGDEASGNYGMAVLWESTEASLAGKAVIGPQLSQHLADNNASANPFSTELFEVLHFKVNE